MKRGRPPKPFSTIVVGTDGRLQFVTRYGPRPKRQGARRHIRDLPQKLRREARLTMQTLTRVERDERLCVAVASEIARGIGATAAIDIVAHAHGTSPGTVKTAYYAHRHRLEAADD